MSTYDKHYKESTDYFGKPYPELVRFFEEYEPKWHVLDLGCGQGRDSIALARMGYKVTGVDNSNVGVSQMLSISDKEKLGINGKVSDIYSYTIDSSIDIVLLDSMLHFYKPDREKEIKFLTRIMTEIRQDGVLCVVVWRSKKIESELEHVLSNHSGTWTSLFDDYIAYPEKNMDMRMIVTRKIS